MYEKTKSCVKVKGGLSSCFPSMIGFRQGCKLSPFIFALFLSDIKEDIKEDDATELGCGFWEKMKISTLHIMVPC